MIAKILLFFFAGLFLLVAFALVIKIVNMMNKCTQPAIAKVLGYQSETKENYDTETGITSTSTVFFPIYEYYVNGERVELKSTTGTSKRNWPNGTDITIRYNPNSPKEIFVPYEVKQLKIVAAALGAIGIVMGALGYFFL